MGSYCQLYISDYPVFSSKSYVDPVVMTLFRESDKATYKRKIGERNPVEWGHIDEDEDEVEAAIEYRARTKYVIQRLDIMGFTIERAEREFNELKVDKIEELREWAEDSDYDFYKEEISILESSTFENFKQAFKTILESRIHTFNFLEKFPDASPLIKYIIKEHEENIWGFLCTDIRCFFRVLLEIAPKDSYVVQDITDIVYAGYYEEGDRVCDLATKDLFGDYPINSKIIILTEGTTDTEILKQSLKLLYPYLYGYYSFMDFGLKPAGGVGPLVNAVKSFAGAGIENRIIALFDNDTAAFSAVDILKNINIPNNIIIRHYPNIELAKNYPTLGPNGMVDQNINGLACSIELYFGKDILEVDGTLTPVQWKGYDERIKRYQGEVMNKPELKKHFLKKIKRAQVNSSAIPNQDWSGIDSILLHIFEAFNV